MTWAIDLAKKVEFQRNLDLKTKIKDTTVIATDKEILDALSNSSLHFVLHGSLINRLFQRFLLAVEENQPVKKWLKKLPWRAIPKLPCERA